MDDAVGFGAGSEDKDGFGSIYNPITGTHVWSKAVGGFCNDEVGTVTFAGGSVVFGGNMGRGTELVPVPLLLITGILIIDSTHLCLRLYPKPSSCCRPWHTCSQSHRGLYSPWGVPDVHGPNLPHPTQLIRIQQHNQPNSAGFGVYQPGVPCV